MSSGQKCSVRNYTELTKPLPDHLLKILFESGTARAHLVQIEKSWLDVSARHDEAPEVIGLLGEMTVASILLSASLKYEGSVILQIHGDGPVRLAVAECNSQLGFRSTVKMSETLLVPTGADWSQLVNQSNMGRFSVVLDPKVSSQAPYQGIVPLHESGVAQALEAYMNRSEQLPTRLWLACDGDRAAGLLLQRMPAKENIDDEWERLVALADTVTQEELVNKEAETLLHQLFWQEKPRLLETKAVQFSCPCSRTRVGKMLLTLGREEVDSILAEQGHVEVNCDFCNTGYQFDAVDCAELFKAYLPPAQSTSQTVH